ncbi:hypothetical protein PMAYCL1PPCAC_08614, partial [Pristionchus mayeri]
SSRSTYSFLAFNALLLSMLSSRVLLIVSTIALITASATRQKREMNTEDDVNALFEETFNKIVNLGDRVPALQPLIQSAFDLAQKVKDRLNGMADEGMQHGNTH